MSGYRGEILRSWNPWQPPEARNRAGVTHSRQTVESTVDSVRNPVRFSEGENVKMSLAMLI